jgi:hypothetical protein
MSLPSPGLADRARFVFLQKFWTETPLTSPKVVPRKKKMTISESALLAVARIVGNQRDILQKWLRRRDARHQHRSPVASGYPTLIRH